MSPHWCDECRGFSGGPCEFPISCKTCDAMTSDVFPDESWVDDRCGDCIEADEEEEEG